MEVINSCSNSQVDHQATLQAGEIIYHPPARPRPSAPGTLQQQLEILALAAQNPWRYVNPDDALQAARRTIMQHARRAPLVMGRCAS